MTPAVPKKKQKKTLKCLPFACVFLRPLFLAIDYADVFLLLLIRAGDDDDDMIEVMDDDVVFMDEKPGKPALSTTTTAPSTKTTTTTATTDVETTADEAGEPSKTGAQQSEDVPMIEPTMVATKTTPSKKRPAADIEEEGASEDTTVAVVELREVVSKKPKI